MCRHFAVIYVTIGLDTSSIERKLYHQFFFYFSVLKIS